MKKLQQGLCVIVLIGISTISSILSGQTLVFMIDSTKYEMTAYTQEDGLPDPNVSSIAQDKDGFIWIGTKSSLSRFDGQRFVNYSNFDKDHFIRRNTINNISIDARGRLVLATDIGIEILNPKSNETKSILPGGDAGLVGARVHTALIDENERLWVSTDRGYSFQYSDDYKSFTYGPPLLTPDEFNHDNHIVSNLVEGKDFIYASAGVQEVWKIEKSTGSVSNYKPRDSLNIRQQIYLMYKEAVTNIIKHANASYVDIRLIKSDDLLTLSIKDNGQGIGSKVSSGQGLSNMRMRAKRVNGEIELRDDEGLEVLVKINIS